MKLIKKIHIGVGRTLHVFATPITWLLHSRRVRSYVLIEQDARVLLVKNWISNGEWSLPGGGSHKHETSLQAAVREVKEEVSLTMRATRVSFLKEGFNKKFIGGKHYALFHYDLPVTEIPKRDKLELVDIAWVPLPSLRSTPKISYEVIAALEARSSVT